MKNLGDRFTLNNIYTDFQRENIMIHDESGKGGKLKKRQLIDKLVEWSDTPLKTNFLKEKIQNEIGHCARINENFSQAFHTAYLSCTFTNSGFSRMEKYFESILIHKIIFPSFKIDDHLIFTSNADFIRYIL